MNSKIRLYSLLTRYPEIESLLTAYDVDPEEEAIQNLNIENFCDEYAIDLEDFLMDLEEIISDSKSAQWLTDTDEDQWTEGFTEEIENDASSLENDFDEDSDSMGNFD